MLAICVLAIPLRYSNLLPVCVADNPLHQATDNPLHQSADKFSSWLRKHRIQFQNPTLPYPPFPLITHRPKAHLLRLKSPPAPNTSNPFSLYFRNTLTTAALKSSNFPCASMIAFSTSMSSHSSPASAVEATRFFRAWGSASLRDRFTMVSGILSFWKSW